MARPALIFDLDGTLADPRAGITRCIRHALETLAVAIPPDAELERLIGPPLLDGFASILGDAARATEAVIAYRECYDGGGGLYESELYPGIEDAIAAMNGMAPAMFVATSKPRVFAERILDRLQLRAYFRAVYGCELSGERADKTELLSYLLKEEQLGGGSAVMIGDRMYDVVAARAHGLRSVGVTWGFGSVEELRDARADALCSSVAELVRWYQSV